MKRITICLFFIGACILSGCASRMPYQFLREAHLSDGKQELKFHTSELVPEQEIYVYVGECWTRPLAKARKIRFESSDEKALEEASDVYLQYMDGDGDKSVHVRLIVQSLVVIDKRVVPEPSLSFTASTTLKTDSRFLSIRVEFPDEGDCAEGVVDLKQGRFIGIDREGEWIGFIQHKKAPVLD